MAGAVFSTPPTRESCYTRVTKLEAKIKALEEKIDEDKTRKLVPERTP
jgi:hypothetical protein